MFSHLYIGNISVAAGRGLGAQPHTIFVILLLGMIWFLVQLIWYSYYSQLPKVGKFKLQDITDPDEELINFERDGIINQKVCASDNYISQ